MKMGSNFILYTPFLAWVYWICILLFLEKIKYVEIQPLRGKILNLGNGFVLCLMIYIFFPLINKIALFFIHQKTYGIFDLEFNSSRIFMATVVNIFIMLFVYDVFFYFWHRAEHTFPLLWSIHEVHHSEKNLNVTSYLRQNWLELILQSILISSIMLSFFKFSIIKNCEWSFLVAAFFPFFTHMNIPLEFGRYSWIITGPQLHRLHHSTIPEHYNSNYAQIFPIIDIIFGTYKAPKPREFPMTGLNFQSPIESIPLSFFWPFKKWSKRLVQN